jgi:hypothetical protein
MDTRLEAVRRILDEAAGSRNSRHQGRAGSGTSHRMSSWLQPSTDNR